MNKIITTLIILALVVIGFCFYKNGDTTISYIPQYINDKEIEGTLLTVDLKALKEEIAKNINYDYSRVVLRAVTPDTVLVSALTNSGPNDCIYSIKDKDCEFVSNEGGVNSVKIGETIVYIDRQEISYYKLGKKIFETLPGSRLESSETYMSTIGSLFDMPNVIRNTDKSITLSVYSVTEMVNDPVTKVYIGQRKMREVEAMLP